MPPGYYTLIGLWSTVKAIKLPSSVDITGYTSSLIANISGLGLIKISCNRSHTIVMIRNDGTISSTTNVATITSDISYVICCGGTQDFNKDRFYFS